MGSDNSNGEVDVSNSRDTHIKRGITYWEYNMFGMEAQIEMCVGYLSTSRGELAANLMFSFS